MSEKAAHAAPILLSFHLNERETFVISADSTSLEPQVDRIAVTASEIAGAAHRLHNFFSRINYRRPEQTTDMAWLAPLGRVLLAPLAQRLRKSTHIVVAPHSAMHSLPLHLLAPGGAAPLGMTHSVSYVPNLSLYAALLERASSAAVEFATPALCLATAAADDPHPVSEAFLIAPRAFAHATGGLFLQGLHASRREFLTQAGGAAMLYLSCHGRFEPADSLGSCLFLSDSETLPSSTAENSGAHALTVRDILGLDIRAPLVVLDACMSGMQRHAAGDEPMGFPTAFLLAGAGAVIASTWPIEQNLARDFMLALLVKWSSGGALGDAMRHAVQSVSQDYPHPFHWGAFSLICNDRLLFSEGGMQ